MRPRCWYLLSAETMPPTGKAPLGLQRFQGGRDEPPHRGSRSPHDGRGRGAGMGLGNDFSPKCGVPRCSRRRGERRVPQYGKVNAGRGVPPDVPKIVCPRHSRGCRGLCPRPPRCLVHTGGCLTLRVGLIYGARKGQCRQLPACGRGTAGKVHRHTPRVGSRKGLPRDLRQFLLFSCRILGRAV